MGWFEKRNKYPNAVAYNAPTIYDHSIVCPACRNTNVRIVKTLDGWRCICLCGDSGPAVKHKNGAKTAYLKRQGQVPAPPPPEET